MQAPMLSVPAPWQQQAQTTAMEIEHVQRQLHAHAQAEDTKARFAAEVAAAAAAAQQHHNPEMGMAGSSPEHFQQQQAYYAAQQHQQGPYSALGIATGSDSLTPHIGGNIPVVGGGISPTLSHASSFGGSPSPSVPQVSQFMPVGHLNASPQQPQQASFMGYNGGAPEAFGFSPSTQASPQMSSHQPSQVSNRTVYVGNLPGDASVDELLNLVRFGPIESVKLLPEKSCAFISFLEASVASAFHQDMVLRKMRLHEQELKIGWGKPSSVSPLVLNAVHQHGASRNVYVGGLPPDITEQELRDDLSRFGLIDQVKVVRDKCFGFVHMLSIATALKVVSALPLEPEWQGKRISFGKDRCAYVPKNQHQQQQHNLQAAAMAASYTNNWGQLSATYTSNGMQAPVPQTNSFDSSLLSQAGNRTVYLGNLHPETTVEEICNAVRGGILQNVRYMPEKHICFVTFVDPNAALAFFTASMQQGITIHARRLKVGWGRHTPLSPGVAMVVQTGGSRNVYIGGLDERFDEEKLRTDFSEFGEIELVNILREKNCGFVNFLSISDAIKSIEGIRRKPQYSSLKVSFGKDRCGNVSRVFHGNQQRSQRELSETHSSVSPEQPQQSGFPEEGFQG